MYDGTLSADDLARIEAECAKWMAIGLSTERCDRPRAEAAVRRAYASAGLAEPETVIWSDSPLGGSLAIATLVTGRSQLVDQLRGQLGGQLRGQLGDQLGDQLWPQLRGQLGDQLGGQLWGQLGGQLGGQLWDQLWDQLRGQLGDQFDPWWDAYWQAYYTCALSLADISSDRLDALAAAQAEVAWWWPMEGAVVLTDRPTVLHVDQQVRFHCEDGPAVAYADGWQLHFWHGVAVPASLVEQGWSVDQILAEPNAEVRRCAIERMGWDRFVSEARLTRVGEPVADPGNDGHSLSLYDVPRSIYDVRVLICDNATDERDGTRRRFGLTVPASIKDPVSAAAWTFGLGPSEYAAMERAS